MTKETVFSKAKLIELTAKTLNNGRNEFNTIPVQLVTQIINAYQSVIDDAIRTANQLDKSVTVKPLNGLQITAERRPAFSMLIGGRETAVPEQTHLTAVLSRSYKQSVNESITNISNKGV